METSACYEIVAYRVNPAEDSNFAEVYELMHREMKQLPGFVKLEHFAKLGSEEEFIDTVTWETQAAAMRGFKLWQALPSTQAFMACVSDVLLSGHYMLDKTRP